MANTVYQVSLGFTDAKGNQARVRHFLSADSYANAAALLGQLDAALAAMSNAVITSAPGIGGILTQSGSYGTAAVYESVTDKASFTFIDSSGQLHRFSCPAPKSAIFLADEVTVDQANALVEAYIDVITNEAAAVSFVCTRAGVAILSYAGGLRTKRPNRKRVSIFTKSGNLDEPAE